MDAGGETGIVCGIGRRCEEVCCAGLMEKGRLFSALIHQSSIGWRKTGAGRCYLSTSHANLRYSGWRYGDD